VKPGPVPSRGWTKKGTAKRGKEKGKVLPKVKKEKRVAKGEKNIPRKKSLASKSRSPSHGKKKKRNEKKRDRWDG